MTNIKGSDISDALKTMTKEFFIPILKTASVAVGGSALVLYTVGGVVHNVWTPKQIKEYNEKFRLEQKVYFEHQHTVDSTYTNLFQDAKSTQDSIDIYQKWGLPIQLLSPTIQQKEEAIQKWSELEKSLE